MPSNHYSGVKLCFALITAIASTFPSMALTIDDVWINEIHYDNTGADTNEMVEIAGIAGTDLGTLSLEFYNGNGGAEYITTHLSGTLSDTADGYGFLSFFISGIQNGAPDGVALIFGSSVLQFLSYEGTFTATDETANGLTSIDIGVYQPSSAAVGSSLQFLGVGGSGSWTGPIASTAGAINTGQTLPKIIAASTSNDPVPDTGASLSLLGLSLFAIVTLKRRISKP